MNIFTIEPRNAEDARRLLSGVEISLNALERMSEGDSLTARDYQRIFGEIERHRERIRYLTQCLEGAR